MITKREGNLGFILNFFLDFGECRPLPADEKFLMTF